MNNKVTLALLSEIFTTTKNLPNLVMLLFYVNQISLRMINDLFVVIMQPALYFFNKTIKTNVRDERPNSLSSRTYTYTLTHPQNNICLTFSGI
jgi:hypothetical protein